MAEASKPADAPVVAPTVAATKAPAIPKAEEPPEFTHYEVLTDTWGYDTGVADAPKKGDVIAAADIGPHHKWAVKNGVVKGITAKEAAAKTEATG